MIQFSFSPNWYRPQCIAFSQFWGKFYYASNCIVYQYDLKQKKIVNELNLKEFLLKNQGYSLSSLLKQTTSLPNKTEEQKCVKKERFDEKSQSEKEKQKILKISAISLIQNKIGSFLIAGFNCIGIIVFIQLSQQGSMKVRQVIDISKENSQFCATEYIYLKENKEKNFSVQNENEPGDTQNQIVVFSPNLLQTIITFRFGSQISDSCIKEVKFKVNRLLNEESGNNHLKNTIKNQQIKLISLEQFCPKASENKEASDNQEEQVDQNQLRQKFYLVFLSLGISNPQQSSKTYNNILLFNHNFSNISYQTNLENLIDRTQPTHEHKDSPQPSSILSSDSIQIFMNNKTLNQFAILTKNNSDKPNLFCQKFSLFIFNSNIFLILSQESSSIVKPTNQDTSVGKVTIQIIYPKKCHHKLSQNQKSTLSIKYIDRQSLLLTGKLGQIFVLNLKQIGSKLQKSPSRRFTLTLRPYSYEQDKNQLWFLEPNQRHYKDIYAIYRVQHKNYETSSLDLKQMTSQKGPKNSKFQSSIHMIGTDHILTSWKTSKNQQNLSLQNRIAYDSSIKFLTSAVEQIVFSQPESSLVFLRLRDSNIRSFEPFSDKAHWLNEFWKHTCNSFSKEIQKLVMHSTQVGLACMVNKDSKIVLYDLYEQRLVKLIEIRQKVKPKCQKDKISTANQTKNNNFGENKPKSKQNKFMITNDGSKKNQNETAKNSTESRPLQINSISFQHVSIIKAIEAFYSSEEFTGHIMTDEAIKESFDFVFQSFYQRQMYKNVVLLIQSNEFIIIVRELSQQYENRRFHVYKKAFKLERVYKTKYWDGEYMLGTRKKKGQLHVGIVGQIDQQKSTKKKLSKENYHAFLEKKVELALGTSSRYLFKLSSLQTVGKKGANQKLLSVINYKGTKLVILIYKLISKTNLFESENNIIQTVKEEKSEVSELRDNFQLQELFCSQEIQVPNLSSMNNSFVLIEHLVISQEEDGFLIAIYNNQLQLITLIDFKDLVHGAISAEKSPTLFNAIKNDQVRKEQPDETCPKRSILSLYPNQESDISDHQKGLLIQSQKLQKDDISNQLNMQQSSKHTLNIHQLDGFSYKIESIAFHKSNPSKDSHLIILGKDQSVRLLPFNLFQSQLSIEVNRRNA